MDFNTDLGDAEAPLVMPMVEAVPFSASRGEGPTSSPPTQRPTWGLKSSGAPRPGGAAKAAAPPSGRNIKPARRDEARPQPGTGKDGRRGPGLSMQQQLEAVEASLEAARRQLEAEVEARCEAERLQAEAARRLEELELERLDFQAERERWRQREAELHASSSAAAGGANAASERRIAELEALLKEAILRGAQLGRAHADSESARATLERRVSRLRALARRKIHGERQRADAASERAERAEERLTEYVEASLKDADALVEAHVRHLVGVGQSLAQKVEEQAEIIEVLRGLLQDHKDFIRQESGLQELGNVGPAEGRPEASGKTPVAPPAATALLPDIAAPAQRSALARLPPPPPDMGHMSGSDSGSNEEAFLLDML